MSNGLKSFVMIDECLTFTGSFTVSFEQWIGDGLCRWWGAKHYGMIGFGNFSVPDEFIEQLKCRIGQCCDHDA